MRHLVIVESPTKAKTIRKFLSSDYTVLASMGHVRDLPASAADVPDELKKTTKGQLGVDVDHDFEPLYLVPPEKKKIIDEIKRALKDADDLYLATDDDREGESISWHLLDLLKPKVPIHRTVFHEITRPAIEAAFLHPRTLDENLVRAQETRRILDRLVGYGISPVLWKKITYGLSAGRVQSAALKAIVDRERARLRFAKAGYWDLTAALTKDGLDFEAALHAVDGVPVASGKDFDEDTGQVKKDKRVRVLDEAAAQALAERVRTEPSWIVAEAQAKAVKKQPSAPFITSTFQQEANRKLGLSTKEAMRAAQALYEHGFITYMRTDSVNLSPEAVTRLRQVVTQRFGADYVLKDERHYATAKGAQEAHEAIRPSLDFLAPDETPLQGIERDVYELIWMRTLASQMSASDQEQTSVRFDVAGASFVANGLRILFPGFLRAYAESHDDPDAALEGRERALPPLTPGEAATRKNVEPVRHETKPPARFTEAGLIQYMEKVGIGRPSTYAAIMSTLLDRGYARKQQSALVPTFTGMIVTQYMERRFPTFVDASFTSRMEQDLDRIAEGKEAWIPYLRAFWSGETTGLKAGLDRELAAAPDEETRRLLLPAVPDIEIRLGRFGTYLEGLHPKHKTPVKMTIPETVSPADLTAETLDELLGRQQQGPTSLGTDAASGQLVYLRTGSFGPYVQLGEESEDKKEKKPKRASVPKDTPLETLDLAKASFLLSLPRPLGVHPSTGKDVKVGFGRFGAYVVHDGEFRSLKKDDSIWTMTLERALALLAEPKGTRGGRGGGGGTPIGTHPKDGQPVTYHSGKYGPYVKHGKVNATVPKEWGEKPPTLEQALELIEKKAPTKKPAARKPRKKTPAA